MSIAGSHTEALQLEETERSLFMRLITHDDRNSYYVLATSGRGVWSEAAYKASRLPYVALNENAACYLTHNGFTRKQRRLDETRQVNALFFDLDCHSASAPEARAAIDTTLQVIKKACDSFAIPTPTMVVDSGRGVHLYYVLDRSIPYRFAANGPSNEKGIGLFRLVERQLADLLEEIVAHIGEIEVDRKVFDFARVSRIPGTYNEAAGCFARLVSASEVFHDLSNLALWKPADAPQRTAVKPPRAKRKGIVIDYQPLMLSRLTKIAELQEHRGFQCEGSRELMCFVFYNTAVQVYSREIAAVRLSQFNRRFASPLAQSELDGIVKSVDRVVNVRGERGHYLIGAKKLIELLGMTAEEMVSLDFFASKRARQRAAAKRETAERRRVRNHRIIELYKEGSYTQAEVARLAGCSERTVASVLKKAKLTRCNQRRTYGKPTRKVAFMRALPTRRNRLRSLTANQPAPMPMTRREPIRAPHRLTEVMSILHYASSQKALDSAKNCLTSLRGVGSCSSSLKLLCLWRI